MPFKSALKIQFVGFLDSLIPMLGHFCLWPGTFTEVLRTDIVLCAKAIQQLSVVFEL